MFTRPVLNLEGLFVVECGPSTTTIASRTDVEQILAMDAMFEALQGDKEGRVTFARGAGIDLGALEQTGEGTPKDTALSRALCEHGMRLWQALNEQCEALKERVAAAEQTAAVAQERVAAAEQAAAAPAATSAATEDFLPLVTAMPKLVAAIEQLGQRQSGDKFDEVAFSKAMPTPPSTVGSAPARSAGLLKWAYALEDFLSRYEGLPMVGVWRCIITRLSTVISPALASRISRLTAAKTFADSNDIVQFLV